MSADPSNVVPFAPEGQVLDGIALLVKEAVITLQGASPTPLAARQARAKLSAAMGFMNVLLTYQAAKEGRSLQVIMVSSAAASAVQEVAHAFASRALAGLVREGEPLSLDGLRRVHLEMTQSQAVLNILLGEDSPRAALG